MRGFFLMGSILLLSACASSVNQPDASASYRAAGNEPFWHLKVTGRQATVERPDAEPTHRTLDEERRSDDGRLLRGQGIEVRIAHVRCEDDMSGAPYADTVSMTLDGRSYRGCGGQGLPPARLEDTQWVVTELHGRSPGEEELPTLAIDDKGGVSDSDGCNRISGGFALLPTGEVQHRPAGWIATRMACAPARMRLAEAYGNALRSAASWRFDGADLLLLNAQGTAVLRYRRAY